MHVPICVPSAEQTVWPGVGQEVVSEPAGADALPELLVEAAEGAVASVLDGTVGALGLSAGFVAAAAAAGGTTAASFSCTGRDGKAAEGVAGATGDALDCAGALPLSLDPEILQPIGVHSTPCTLPLPVGAIVLNMSSMTSRSPYAQDWQVSATVAVVTVLSAGLWTEICLPQYGLLLGFPVSTGNIMSCERATMDWPFVITWPQEPGKHQRSALFQAKEGMIRVVRGIEEPQRKNDDIVHR